ncbi:MAG: FG-GAP repeat domain-containing protein [Candidatus Methylomirabilia bacterium]
MAGPLAVVLASLALFFCTDTQLARSAPLPFQVLAEQVAAFFPKVEGDVIEAQGAQLTISLGRRDGLQPDVEMVLFREGRELRHPKTGELLGHAEKRLGQVIVGEVFETHSLATVTEGGGARSGDRVRVSSGKIKLTVLKLVSGLKEDLAEAATRELIGELGRTGRFQVMFGDQVGVWLTQERIARKAFLDGAGVREALARFKIDYLLVLGLSKVQKKPYLEVRLFSRGPAEPLLNTALFVPASIRAPPSRQFSSAPGAGPPPSRAPRRSLLARLLGGNLDPGTYSAGAESIPVREVARFGFLVRTMDVAVAPKDGIPRLVITDGSKIFLYRIVGQKLEVEWTYGRRSIGQILSLQLADLDGDGSLEVVVNRQEAEAGMLSQILSDRSGRPEAVVEDIPLILLAVDESGEGVKRALWGQIYSNDTFFTPGQADRYVLKDGPLASSGSVKVPYSFRATGATLSNIAGKDVRALVFVDAEQRLRVSVNGQERWQSSTQVGGGFTRGEIQEMISGWSVSRFFEMALFPVAVDLDGDGVDEVVVPINQGEGGLLGVIFRGPAGYRIQVVNSGFQGAISSIGAIPDPEAPRIIASVVRSTGLLGFIGRKGETQIIMTIPPE